MKFIDFSHFRKDLLGGITAGIVALPLALAFGEQSGLGAVAGLYGAAFIAFFAALFGGTATQISGPTAPMTALSMVVIAGILQVFDGQLDKALPVILAVFLAAGLIQIGMGMLKLGAYIRFIPHTVVSGFMSGIGVIILLTQLLPALGYYSQDDGAVLEQMRPRAEQLLIERVLESEAEDGVLVLDELKQGMVAAESITEEEIEKEARTLAANVSKGVTGSLSHLPSALKSIRWTEFLLALGTIALIYLFPLISKAVPSTLVALLVVSGVAYFLDLEYMLISEIPTGIPAFRSDIFTGFDLGAFAPYILSAFMLALLGAIDSLLTSVVADNLTKTSHDSDQELMGQGIGNSVAALFAGLPGAGATIRTVVNIQAGGRTKVSGMVAGVLLFVILLFLGPIASNIPAAVLAGILITVGIGVIDYKGLKALPAMQMSDKLILLTVLLLTVFWQLVYAVFVGLIMAAFVFLKRMSDLTVERVTVTDLDKVQALDPLWEDEKKVPREVREKVVFKHLEGPIFFGMVSDFRKLMSQLPDLHVLVIRMENVPFVDQSGVRALGQAIEALQSQEVIVALSGVNDRVEAQLTSLKVIPDIVVETHVFEHFEACTAWLKILLDDQEGLAAEILRLKAHRTGL